MNKTNNIQINTLLLLLILLDTLLATIAFFFPSVWFHFFHHSTFLDPQGFFRRAGAHWAAFALFQGLAFFQWKHQPYWLVLVAGIRLSDIFTDWTTLYFSQNLSFYGEICLGVASPANLLIGLFLIRQYQKKMDAT